MQRIFLLLATLALTACSTPRDDPASPSSQSSSTAQRHPATYASGTADPQGPRPFAYRTHIRPLMQSRCVLCHCPSLASRAGGLDLTTREAALTTGRNAPVIIPGSAATSPFMRKLTETDPQGQVIPRRGGPHALSQRALDNMTKWINQGADWTY